MLVQFENPSKACQRMTAHLKILFAGVKLELWQKFAVTATLSAPQESSAYCKLRTNCKHSIRARQPGVPPVGESGIPLINEQKWRKPGHLNLWNVR